MLLKGLSKRQIDRPCQLVGDYLSLSLLLNLGPSDAQFDSTIEDNREAFVSLSAQKYPRRSN